MEQNDQPLKNDMWIRTNLFTWQDVEYQEFMIEIMTYLEPRKADRQEILFEELEDIEEVLFFSKGSVDMGYEINKKKIFKLRFKNANLIGAFYAMFNRKTMFLCKASSECQGFSIRKSILHQILKNHEDIAVPMKLKVLDDFHKNIKHPMMIHKRRDIQ